MRQRIILGVLAAIAVLFGLATIVSGARVILVAEARLAAGHVVLFVLWFNFLAGFLYVTAGVGLWRRGRWAVWLSAGIAAVTILVYAAFGVHAIAGGAYETRTVAAMAIRTLVWIGITLLGYQQLVRGKEPL